MYYISLTWNSACVWLAEVLKFVLTLIVAPVLRGPVVGVSETRLKKLEVAAKEQKHTGIILNSVYL